MVEAPESLVALQQQVRHLHAEARPWLPAGSASRLDWGPAVVPGSVVLSCRGLAGIQKHNPGDFTLRVAAGTPLVEVQAALAHHGQWLSLDLPWGGDHSDRHASSSSGSIGGLIARGLAGGYRQRYMGVRDQLIGIELLRSDGVLARAGGQVVKNVAGYDLMRLLSGSWGSLALITQVTLRTQPLPPQRRVLVVQHERTNLEPLWRWLLNSSLSPERVDVWSEALAASAGLAPQPLLLVSLASIDAGTLAEQIACIGERAPGQQVLDPEAGSALQAAARGIASDGTQAAADWLLRVAVPPLQSGTLLACPELQGLPAVVAAGSGIGDAWASASQLPRHRVEALRRRCTALGGYLTVLRQPPAAAGTAPVPAWLDAPSRPLIEAVKREFDPKQQLARGRLPGVAAATTPASPG
ncbi:MAG: FAD-binding oxidoreductase [Cyanobacteria bacterium K_DeepCast_35m_m2_023]|nr:FAD-binding oxidoreductase [Cyanobacteria bacterium K_DeepCast_35m_m2_023]